MYHDTPTPQPPEPPRTGFFGALPSKTAFFAGFAGGIMTFSTLGFVLMLAGGINLDAAKSKSTVWGANPPAAPSPSPTPAVPPQGAVGTVEPVTDADHVRGDLNKADIVLIEYSDFECPFCQRFHPTMQQVKDTYGDRVAWVYRHFPLSFHANAQPSAEAAECAGEQGKFWEYADKLFEMSPTLDTASLLSYAKAVGLNESLFKTCVDSKKHAVKVTAQMSGGEIAGISGTPGTILLTKDGRSTIISGAQEFATVKATIDSYLP